MKTIFKSVLAGLMLLCGVSSGWAENINQADGTFTVGEKTFTWRYWNDFNDQEQYYPNWRIEYSPVFSQAPASIVYTYELKKGNETVSQENAGVSNNLVNFSTAYTGPLMLDEGEEYTMNTTVTIKETETSVPIVVTIPAQTFTAKIIDRTVPAAEFTYSPVDVNTLNYEIVLKNIDPESVKSVYVYADGVGVEGHLAESDQLKGQLVINRDITGYIKGYVVYNDGTSDVTLDMRPNDFALQFHKYVPKANLTYEVNGNVLTYSIKLDNEEAVIKSANIGVYEEGNDTAIISSKEPQGTLVVKRQKGILRGVVTIEYDNEELTVDVTPNNVNLEFITNESATIDYVVTGNRMDYKVNLVDCTEEDVESIRIWGDTNDAAYTNPVIDIRDQFKGYFILNHTFAVWMKNTIVLKNGKTITATPNDQAYNFHEVAEEKNANLQGFEDAVAKEWKSGAIAITSDAFCTEDAFTDNVVTVTIAKNGDDFVDPTANPNFTLTDDMKTNDSYFWDGEAQKAGYFDASLADNKTLEVNVPCSGKYIVTLTTVGNTKDYAVQTVACPIEVYPSYAGLHINWNKVVGQDCYVAEATSGETWNMSNARIGVDAYFCTLRYQLKGISEETIGGDSVDTADDVTSYRPVVRRVDSEWITYPSFLAEDKGVNLQNAASIDFRITKNGVGGSDNNTAKSVTISHTIGVGVDEVEAADNAEAVYYTLQGVRVPAEGLQPGIYVIMKGGKASKVLVK